MADEAKQAREQAAEAQARHAAAQRAEFERLQREGNSPLMSLAILKGPTSK